jgi:hypothetical protein
MLPVRTIRHCRLNVNAGKSAGQMSSAGVYGLRTLTVFNVCGGALQNMNNRRVLRICVVLEWVVVIVGVGLAFVLEGSLPDPLKAWLKAEEERGLGQSDYALLCGGVLALVMAILSSVGLLCLRRWASWLYLLAVVLGCLTSLFGGPVVQHVIPDVVDEIAVTISGLILGLAFFSDALRPRGTAPVS